MAALFSSSSSASSLSSVSEGVEENEDDTQNEAVLSAPSRKATVLDTEVQNEIDQMKEVDDEYAKMDVQDEKISKAMDENDDPTNRLFPNEKYSMEQMLSILEYWRQFSKNEINPTPKQRARLFHKHLADDRYFVETKPKNNVIVVTEMMALHVYGITKGRLTCPVDSTFESFERASPAMQRIRDFLKDHYNLGGQPMMKIPFSRPIYVHARLILEAHFAPAPNKPKPPSRTNTPSLSRSSSSTASPSISIAPPPSSNNINLPNPPDRSAAAAPPRNRPAIRSVQDMDDEMDVMDIEDRALGIEPLVQPAIPIFRAGDQNAKRGRPKSDDENSSDVEYEDEDEKKKAEKRKKKKVKAEKEERKRKNAVGMDAYEASKIGGNFDHNEIL